jgi:hypothetical protein
MLPLLPPLGSFYILQIPSSNQGIKIPFLKIKDQNLKRSRKVLVNSVISELSFCKERLILLHL